MSPYSLISALAELAGILGVPPDQRVLAAWILFYLGASLIVAVVVVLLLRARRRLPRPRLEAAGLETSGQVVPTGEVRPETAPQETPTPLAAFRRGLARTSASLAGRIDALLRGRPGLSPELLEEVEEILVTADVGIRTTRAIISGLEEKLRQGRLGDPESFRRALREEVRARVRRLAPAAPPITATPHVVMVVGVNGVGKTTTIGKLAHRWCAEGRKVLLAAGDTFRAAAADQLAIWAERTGAGLVRQAEGGDPGAVAYDACHAAISRATDVLIVDTAGRLHTKTNLMEELKKVRRILAREVAGAPHETLLVLDASTGQNGLEQARQFHDAVAVTGLVLTKLDGTAKGGVVLAIAEELGLPLRFVGIGESVADLCPFDPELFVEALFPAEESN